MLGLPLGAATGPLQARAQSGPVNPDNPRVGRLKAMWRPFRSAISFLADLGGALVAVVVAVGFIVAAGAGAILVATDLLPQPFLTMMIFGLALGASGVTLHFLRDPLTPTPAQPDQPVEPPPELEDLGPDQGLGAIERATEMTREYEVRRLRKALRSIAEDELEGLNRFRLLMFQGGMAEGFSPATAQWSQYSELLKESADAEVYRLGAAAYAAMRDLADAIGGKGPQSVLVKPLTAGALTKVDQAIEAMRKAAP